MTDHYFEFLASFSVEPIYEPAMAVIEALYKDGMSLRALALALHIPVLELRSMLVDSGVTIRGKCQLEQSPMSPSQMRTAYESGRTLREIASECGLSSLTVRKHILSSGGVMRPAYTREIEYPVERWAKAYKAGKSLIQIGREHGVNMNTVRKRLAAAGVTIRPRGSNRLVSDDSIVAVPYRRKRPSVSVSSSTLADSYRAGKSLREIAEEHGISSRTVQRRLVGVGVTIRSRGKSKAVAA